MCAVGAQRKFRAGGQIQISNRNFFVDSGTDPRKHIRTCPSPSVEENIVAPLVQRYGATEKRRRLTASGRQHVVAGT